MLRALVAVPFLVASTPVSATLIEVDLYGPGDALITRDTETGLDWLDVTEAHGLSYDEVMSGSGGWIEGGWRYANTAEVCDILTKLGTEPSPCPGIRSEAGDAGQRALDLLGYTDTWGGGPGETVPTFWAFFEDDPGDPALGEVEISVYYQSNGNISTWAGVLTDYKNPGETGDSHLLVKTSPIPEPCTGLLLAAGLLALAIQGPARRSRRNS